MDFEQVVAKRRMIRAFSRELVDPETISGLLAQSLKAPSAGNTAAVEFLVLSGQSQVDEYWNITLAGDKREKFRWQQLLDAPVLVIVTTRPNAYPERYGEPDKARASLSSGIEQWPIPYWYVDAGCVVQNLLLGVSNRSLGACLFGLFSYEEAVRSHFEIPKDRRLVGTVAIGHPLDDEPGRSAKRERPNPEEVIHHQVW